VEDVIAFNNQPGNTINALSRSHGDGTVRAILALCLTDMLKFFNLTQGTMDKNQVIQTILLIQEDYGHIMTMADFKVFFNKIKKGHFAEPGKSQVYNRIDGQLILEWMERYVDERASVAETNNQIKGHQLKERDQRTYTTEMVQRLFGEHRFQSANYEANMKRLRDKLDRDVPIFNEKNESYYSEQLKTK
jgi:hypothetical protein